jgi:pre-mRNA-splicing factor SYF2/beta-D-xylosidase 4
MVDSYMAPFQACVELGRVSGLMCSYNAVNGVPSCANNWLLTEVARGDWNFDGYITSDCDADADVYYNHHYTSTPEETVRDVLRAGTDVDCTSFVPQFANSALQKGLINEADLNLRLSNLFRVRMRLGHFDPVGPLDKIPASIVCSPYAQALARDGVVQSSALLKNAQNTLPLSASARLNIAVIGPNSNLSKSIAGYYGPSNVCGYNYWNLVDAVAQYAG